MIWVLVGKMIKSIVFSYLGKEVFTAGMDDAYDAALHQLKAIMMAGDIIVTEPAHYSKFRLKDWIARGSRVLQNSRWPYGNV
jgi:hypothetical protein